MPEELPGVSVRVKGQGDELPLELGKSGQADWIRNYMEQEQEEESSQVDEVCQMLIVFL